ncbi:MAG: hypothetical protein DLM57_06085 [Pseudonocardiales bacterium]|nr:MAG: hypothetical protein DLM57_06085 [Pseudonocardiales bacterium]
MNIEDRLRDVMIAHEHEAPGLAQFMAERALPGSAPRREHRAWFAGAAAACVLAVAVVLAMVAAPRAHQRQAAAPPTRPVSASTSPALACPGRSQQHLVLNPSDYWVPAQAQGVDARQRLVPNRTPAHVVVCAYLQGPALTGHKELRGDLATVTAALTWTPPSRLHPLACTDVLLITDADNYLVGLSYASGMIWVAAPGNHCAGSSNGQFTVDQSAAVLASSWYKSGAATAPATAPCDAAGRLGQERAMVPAAPTSLTICHSTVGNIGHVSTKTVTAGFEPLSRALNSLPTTPAAGSCDPTTPDRSYGESYHLIFHYAAGPPVEVDLAPQCPPSVTNLWLQSTDSTTIVPLVRQLLTGR